MQFVITLQCNKIILFSFNEVFWKNNYGIKTTWWHKSLTKWQLRIPQPKWPNLCFWKYNNRLAYFYFNLPFWLRWPWNQLFIKGWKIKFCQRSIELDESMRHSSLGLSLTDKLFQKRFQENNYGITCRSFCFSYERLT